MTSKRKRKGITPAGEGRWSQLMSMWWRPAKWIGFVVLVVVMVLVTRSYRQREWQGIETFRFLWYVTAGEDVSQLKLYQYLPNDSALVVFDIPTDTYARLSDGYGDYSIKQVLRLAKQESKSDLLLKNSMEETFGYDIHAILEGKEEGSEIVNNYLLRSAVKNIWDLGSEENGYDLLQIWWGVRNVAGGKSYPIDLEELNVYEYYVDVDGEEKRKLSHIMLDDLINRTIPSANDEYFDTQVVVVNSTEIPGLASGVGRLISHEGFDVVRVMDESGKRSLNELWFESEELKQSLAGQKLISLMEPLIVRVEDTSEYRADVVVHLGDKLE